MKSIFYIALLALISAALPAYAQQVEYFKVQSGTGFFVNRDYLVSNAHVVKDCKNVIISGAVPEQEAEVVVLDNERDMALIKSHADSSSFAPLRTDIGTLEVGDNVMLVGYPGEKGITGEVSVAQAKVQKLELNSVGQPWQFYISDVVQQGNSGGPVLDTSGNVIGMVMGMMQLKTVDMYSNKQLSEERLGVVISLRALKHFLENQGVYLQWGGSSLLTYTNTILEEDARRYIVNVQCRTRTSSPAAVVETTAGDY